MYIHFNGNPCGKDTIDCVIRAISIAAEMPWRKVYAGLSVFGYIGCTWGNVNEIWGRYMAYLGYRRSNAQRRDSMGRFSRDDAKADMIADLQDMMQDAPDEQMRKKLQRFIGEIENV